MAKINKSSKQNVSAGTIMCFKRKHGDKIVYHYEVSVPSGYKPSWIRCGTLEEAIDLDRQWNHTSNGDHKVHIVRTWLPEGQRDEYID